MKKLTILLLVVFVISVVGLLLRQNYLQGKRINVLVDLVDNKNKEIENQEKKELLIDKYPYLKEEIVNQQPVPLPDNNAAVNFQAGFERKCQEEQAAYNSCLIKYNTEMLEYQSCQSGDKTFGCSLSSWEPTNTCGVNVSSWCRKQILGHY